MSVRVEAQAVLDECGPETPRELLVWAAGAVICDAAHYFASLPILADKLPGWGWPGCRGRIFDCGRTGVHIYASVHAYSTAGGRGVVPPVLWSEIAALATLDRIGLPLHQRILAAVAERDAWVALRPDQRLRSWGEVMDESQALAGLVWQRCRPGVTRQLDMLDLIGAAP